jgi:tetratricopeptide (TPR) repeat protein
MQVDQRKIKENPFIGPRPFGRNLYDQLRFFGRKYETEEILTQILSHQLVLIYAQSGAGKTSILNANVIPELEKEGFDVLPIARVGISSNTYINFENDSGNNEISIFNHYMFNALWSIKPETDPKLLSNKSLTDFINEYLSTNNDNANNSLFSKVIIFDQLEELFSIFPKDWHEEQITFFKQIADALNKYPHLRIVFVIREDYLAQLDPFTKTLPEKLRPRFRLERLRKDAAIQAIKGPLERANYNIPINEIEQIVQDLMKIKVETITGESLELIGDFIEPIHLQVVCQRWWHERFIAEYITTKSNSNLLPSDLTNVNRALEDFYIKCIQNAVKQTNVKEDRLRKWCEENLITSSGTRSNVHLEANITKGIPSKSIEILADSYLIRREWRSGAPWYELTHDRLIEPIKEANKDWFNKKVKSKRAFHIKVTIPVIIIFIIGISLYAISLQENYQNDLEQQRLELRQGQELVQSDRLVLQHLTNGIKYFGLGNFQQANSEFTKALSINQSSTDALFYKALTAQQLGQYDKSRFYYNKLNAIDPSYSDRFGNTTATR